VGREHRDNALEASDSVLVALIVEDPPKLHHVERRRAFHGFTTRDL
jgi:hypothetical protein